MLTRTESVRRLLLSTKHGIPPPLPPPPGCGAAGPPVRPGAPGGVGRVRASVRGGPQVAPGGLRGLCEGQVAGACCWEGRGGRRMEAGSCGGRGHCELPRFKGSSSAGGRARTRGQHGARTRANEEAVRRGGCGDPKATGGGPEADVGVIACVDNWTGIKGGWDPRVGCGAEPDAGGGGGYVGTGISAADERIGS